ncbi:hypothetical protein Ciccas_001483 [Cichlidogyrus casuarinus]|uniref:Uncharacterized protein n=1 Tax=Cichlidogyrus casuarinus TaxID=1844966 RepID=A0ABD2QK18_9PLAT
MKTSTWNPPSKLLMLSTLLCLLTFQSIVSSLEHSKCIRFSIKANPSLKPIEFDSTAQIEILRQSHAAVDLLACGRSIGLVETVILARKEQYHVDYNFDK